MKNIKLNLAVLFIAIAIQASFAQEHEMIAQLQLKVKEFERKQSNVLTRVCKKGCSGRKYFVNTQIDSSRVFSKHKTKYFKSGAKKEKLKYVQVSKNARIVLLYVVRINGMATYIKYCETDFNIKREQGIVQEEVLIDNTYYQKRSFDKYGHLTNTENIYIPPRDK
ncbi:MAG: hypothetical protein IPN60_07940 [Saprospiraceae bacterium]|nr:hypothetical protein [Candidatus Opimibacter skivensis]